MNTSELPLRAWWNYGLLLTAMALAGCAAPAFQQPEIELPHSFKEAAVDGEWKLAQPAEAQERGEWWKVFHDRVLDKLIDDASAANQNLAAAAARVKQARALSGVAQADRSPQLGVQAGAERGRASSGPPGGAPAGARNMLQAGLTASYEVDLFGRVSSNVSAAQADAAAGEANFRSVLLALQADVAQTYFRIRAADAELAVLAETVRLREESQRITQRRFDLGDVGELDLARSKTESSITRSEALAVARQRAQLEHALAVLLGKPAAFVRQQDSPLAASAVLPGIPAGLPSDLLERRPDISAAQRAMIAANARIGVARAARFPALRLTAAGGVESSDLSDLILWSSRSWLIGALVSLPVVDGGRNRQNVARSEAVLEETVAAYRQTVLHAFAEVEDHLVGLRTLAGQSGEIDEAVLSARRSVELAEKRVRNGQTAYLDLLDAQRNLTSAERTAVQLRGARATTTVALIRALGGGW